MTKREKQATIIAVMALLAIGTGFAFFGPKEKPEDEKPDDEPDEDDCPVGTVKQADGTCKTIIIVDPVFPPQPDDGDIDDLIKDVPVGGNFYAVKYGDVFQGQQTSTESSKPHHIAWMLYRRECWEAAKQFGGLDDGEAWGWVNSIPQAMGQVGKVYDILLCSAFNDACYGTWGYCGSKAVQLGTCSKVLNQPGPHGRAIQLMKRHPNNFARIKNKKVIARYATIGSSKDAGDGRSKNKSGQKGYYPQLWMPKLDRKRLWDSHGADIDTTPETWEDGSPMSSPPPWIMRDGQILDFSGTLTLPGAYGCGGQQVQFTPGAG